MTRILICGLLIAAFTCTTSAEWRIPGLANEHPLSQSQAGELLMGELRCGACHDNHSANLLLEKSAPDLADVGARAAPGYLKRFLVSPSAAHPGTTMPDLLASESESKRNEIAEALTHFLVAQSSREFQFDTGEIVDAGTGKDLFHSVGCVACHAPRELTDPSASPVKEIADDEGSADQTQALGRTGIVELGHVPAKYSRTSLSEFLFQPLRVRSTGRMPDMKLTHAESHAIADYLLSESLIVPHALQPKDNLVSLGKKYFAELNCAACHRLGDLPARPLLGTLRNADLTAGCLSDKPSNVPQYHLNDTQREGIRMALRDQEQADTAQVQIAKTMTAYNCIACHIRDDFGGVAEDRIAFFKSTEKNIGDDARIPPPLTLLGAKLQPAWLKKVLFDGESVRPYMDTRMPQYGEPNLRHLPDLLNQADSLESVDLNIPMTESRSKEEREREKILRAAGRELLGQQGLFCVACHSFNGKPAAINKGIDLMTSYQRLQPGWFNNFLRNPGQYRPRIVMPYSWPGGVAVHEKILDGNTEMQIEALWYYLSLGTSAADPPGIRRVDTVLSVEGATRTYRGRSSVAGFRGIAVGFPERLSYAFNAETGSLTALWQGKFIRVDRGGQGSGGFNPASPPIQLAQDVSFAQLQNDASPWPLRPVMTKESPANPDPLYPKNLGYQFKGYYFDDASVPTFMYRFGEVAMEDRSVAQQSESKLELVRTIQFDSTSNRSLWFRAMTGNITTESKSVYKVDKLRIKIPDLPSTVELRPTTSDVSTLELLLKLDIPQGRSFLKLYYEPLKD